MSKSPWDQVLRVARNVDVDAKKIRRGIISLHRRMRSHEFSIWRNEWNKKHGVNGSLNLPEILIDLNQRQQLYAVARGILASIKESLSSGRGMGDRKTVAQATQEHRRRMMSAPTRPRTDAFKKRYQGEPSKGGSAWGYDSGLLVDGLKLRKLRGRKKKSAPSEEIVFPDIAYAISPPGTRYIGVAIQYNKREPLIALTQRDVDRALQMIIDKVIKVRAPRKKA